MSKIIRKISIKTCVGDVKRMVAAGEIKKQAPVLRILGSVHGSQHGSSTLGDWVAFKGRFRAINVLTGEEFTSVKAFLPDMARDELETALAERDNDLPIAIGIDILVTPDATSPVGYVYDVAPIFAPEADDVLDRLTSDAAAIRKLPKPKVAVGE